MLQEEPINRVSQITNYLLVFGLIAVSGMPYFFSASLNIFILFAVVLIVYLKRSIPIDLKGLGIISVFFAIEILQSFFIHPIAPATFIGSLVRLFLGLLIVILCAKRYTHYYINILYFLSIISFVFFIPSFLFPGVYAFFVNSVCPMFVPPFAEVHEFYVAQPTIMIYTFHVVLPEGRNSGPFWEPGAFAIFILFALIFNSIKTKQLWNTKNIVFSLALISTLSTSGVIAYFITVVSYYFVTGNLLRNTIILLVAVPLGVFLYFNLEFLNSKITKNMEVADYDSSSRFGSAVADIRDFSTSPIIGWGKGAMRFGGKQFTFFDAEQHRNNGLTDLLASYGIVVFFVLLYNYFHSLRALCKYSSFSTYFAGLSFAIILILSFSQSIFQYPFFLSFMFVHLAYKNSMLGSG